MPKILACRIVLLAALSLPAGALGQVDSTGAGDLAMTWTQVVDGRTEAWPREAGAPPTDPASAAESLLEYYFARGHYGASIDSAAFDSASGTLWVAPGQRTTVASVVITGAQAFPPRQLVDGFETRPGTVLRQDVLERDLDNLLKRYDEAGLVLASAQVVRLAPTEDDPHTLDIAIHVNEGPLLELGQIELNDGIRTTPTFVSRATRMRVGEPLTGFDPAEMALRLEETGLFASVDSLGLAINDDQEAVLRVAVTEEPPGSFDALLGYLPTAGSDGGGAVVGDVNILLTHVLGGGRSFGFRFRRSPGSITRANLFLEDPYILGLPLRLAGRFDGFQQDSTFDTRSYGLEGGYRIQRIELFANASRELTRPGSAQSSEVPSSDSWFVGIGFSYRSVDDRLSPSRGFEIESNVENGRKERELTRSTPEGGTERVLETNYQQRLRAHARLFMPVQRRSVAVLGVDTRAIQSRTYDEADLIRFGGANSMRGYNEDQFQGNLTIRALAEWRYRLERRTFMFAFVDVGYVNRPELNTSAPAERVADLWLAGYGVGLQLDTQAGMFTTSLAFNADEGLDAKVHIGMTLGL